MSAETFVARLRKAVPEFEDHYAEHLADYGEILPHVLMGDFTRWFIALYRRSRPDTKVARTLRARLRSVVDFLDRSFQRDPASRELLSTSFLENLHQAGDDYQGIRSQLGPHLLRELDRIEK
jgi:hypothetical protein